MIDVSIIIVNYNTRELTSNCLESIYTHTKDISFEVIVSDNGSTDGSIDMIKEAFPQVILMENGENFGFGAANNRGAKIAKGKYLLLLNSDTVLLNNAVKLFFDYWENAEDKDKIGALGGVLLDEKLQPSLSFGYFLDINQYYKNIIRQLASEYIKPIIYFFTGKQTFSTINNEYYGDVDFVSGADLFIRNDKKALFDENYFMYYEETDLQYNMRSLGLIRRIIAGPKIIHYWGGSSKSSLFFSYKKKTNIYSDLSSLKFLKKNLNSKFHFNCIKIIFFFVWLLPNNFIHTNKYIRDLMSI